MISCGKLSGEFTRKISVETNDPSHPMVTLVCKGRIMEALTLKPKRINFRKVSRTTPGQKKKIVITPGDAGPLKLKLLPLESEFFDAHLSEIEAGKHYELEVTLKTPLPAKSVRANVKLETGIAQAPVITIIASATPRPHVVADPRRFTVPVGPKPDWHQSVRLQWDDDAPHRILGVSSSDPALEVNVAEKEGQQEVVLGVPENYEPKRGTTVVTITTDDKQAPTVRVPIYFSRKAPSPAARRAKGKIDTRAKAMKIRAKQREARAKKRESKAKKVGDPGAKAKEKPSPSTKSPAPAGD